MRATGSCDRIARRDRSEVGDIALYNLIQPRSAGRKCDKEARACLGPDDPVSRAAIVFGSTGSVTSVRVSGFAAGKPAEGCIKGALGKARLAPFAEPTYTANITIRH